MTGIYCITNLINGKKYIGQSVNIKNRWLQEKNLNGINKHLKSAFQKYGLESFSFQVLEECSQEELNQKEQEYIKKFNTTDREAGYNQTTGGDHYKVANRTPMSEETKRKISEKRKGMKFSEEHKSSLKIARSRRPPMSDETRKKISQANKGRHVSEEQKRKISRANKGRKRTEEQKLANSLRRKGKTYEEIYGPEMAQKIKENNSRKMAGRKLSREHIEKIRVGNKKLMKKVKCSNGKIYSSIKEAAIDTNNLCSNIVAVCKGRQKTSHGLIYEYLEGSLC